MRIPISSHPHQNLFSVVVIFYNNYPVGCEVVSTAVLTYISPMISNAEHLFMCFLAICISSSAKCLFMPGTFYVQQICIITIRKFPQWGKIRWKNKNWNKVESDTHAQFLLPLGLTCRLFPGDSEAGGPWLGRAWLAHASVRTFVMVTSMAYGVDVRVSGHTKRIPSKDANVFRVKHFRRSWMEISLPSVCQFAPLFWRHGKTPS